MRAAWVAGSLLATAAAAGFIVGCQSVLGFQDFTTRSADAATGDDGPPTGETEGGNGSQDAWCTSTNEGKACNGSGSICRSGICLACDSTSCPNGCCGTAGCIATDVQTANACGTGTACMACTGGMTCQQGNCACPAGQSSCGGTCETLDGSDAKNCGGCGKACASGVCNAGQCAPYVVAGGTTTSLVDAIASDGTNLVWTDSGLKAVMSIPVAGTTGGQKATTVKSSSSFTQLGGVAISGSTIAWVMSTPNAAGISDSEIWTQAGEEYSFSGSSLGALYGPVLQSAGTFAGGALSAFVEVVGIDSTTQGFTGTLSFYSCPLNCSSPPCTTSSCQPTGGTSTGSANGVVGNASGVYYGMQPYAPGSGTYGVWYDHPSANMGFDWVDPPVFQGLSADAQNVYWAQATAAAPNTFGIQKSAAIGLGTANAAAVSFPSFTASFVQTASDGTYLYVLTQSTSGSSGTIQVVPLAGGTPKPLYDGTAPVDLIAVGGSIYFVDSNVIYGLPYP
jgi:hypothetical protein